MVALTDFFVAGEDELADAFPGSQVSCLRTQARASPGVPIRNPETWATRKSSMK